MIIPSIGDTYWFVGHRRDEKGHSNISYWVDEGTVIDIDGIKISLVTENGHEFWTSTDCLFRDSASAIMLVMRKSESEGYH